MCIRDRLGLASEALQKHISSLSSLPLEKLDVTKQHCTEEQLKLTPNEFFNQTQEIHQIVDYVTLCLFCTNPVDAAFNIYKANMAIASHLASINNDLVEKSQKFDDMFKIWRIAIIAAQIPEPDQLFEWLSMYLNLEVMPPKLAAACKIPQMVITTMLTESLAMKN